MARKSPLQVVKEEFGSKEALADKLIPLLDRRDGEEDAAFAQRIRTASNKQLLRLWAAEQRVKTEFGTKAALAAKIAKLRFAGGNADYERKLMTYAKTRLLDLHDSLARRAA
jgi:hypothetical protein